jgi:hypothetical protein
MVERFDADALTDGRRGGVGVHDLAEVWTETYHTERMLF